MELIPTVSAVPGAILFWPRRSSAERYEVVVGAGGVEVVDDVVRNWRNTEIHDGSPSGKSISAYLEAKEYLSL